MKLQSSCDLLGLWEISISVTHCMNYVYGFKDTVCFIKILPQNEAFALLSLRTFLSKYTKFHPVALRKAQCHIETVRVTDETLLSEWATTW